MKRICCCSPWFGLVGVCLLAPALAQDPAAENLPAASVAAGDTGYLEAVSEEAGAAAAAQSAPPTDPTPVAATRANRIQSIVTEALDAPEGFPSTRATELTEEPVAERSPEPRRQRLREAVSNAAKAARTTADPYLQTLQQEGKRTVVIDEQTSKRTAVAPSAQAAAERSTAEAGESGRIYRVRPGDSLWVISQRFYGDGYQYPTLYEANRDRINDENLLVVGQLLRIP